MALTIQGIDPSQNPALAEIEAKTGPSNFFRVLGHRPEAMQQVARLYQTIMGPGTLDLKLKEMIYIAVSAVNESDYCYSHHSSDGLHSGLSSHDIEDLRAETNQNFSPKEQAALHFAREMAREASPENSTRSDLQKLFSPDQQVELALVVALANFTNRISNGLNIPFEKPDRHHAV